MGEQERESRYGTLLEEAQELLPDAVRLRRTLHRRPEIGLDLPATQDVVLQAVDGLGLHLRTGEQTTSVIGVLEGARPGPTFLLRGDMDALPMPEDTGLDYASTVDGAMHACGHDLHMSMLAGAARLLATRRAEIAGRVLFMFQPGEEGWHGARVMLDEGLLDGAGDVVGAFALHVGTQIPAGVVAVKGGPILASSDKLTITVTGKGGHASAPHTAVDPIPVACEIVQAIQTLITRRIDVFDPAVVTITTIHTGTAYNVIPEVAHVAGTIRAVSDATRRRVHDGLRRLVDGIAAAHDVRAEVDIELGFPVTVNHDPWAERTLEVAGALLGEHCAVAMASPIMGAEDFSYVLQRVPGAIAFLGACPKGMAPGQAPNNHSNRVTFDEDVMASGIAMYAAMALREIGAGS